MLLRTLLALGSGAALTLAFEPAAIRLLIPFALAGLVLSVRGLPARRAWWPGLVFGLVFMTWLQHWMTAIGTDAWIGISLVEALFFAPLGSALATVQRLRWWPLWTAAVWVAVESVRTTWPFGGMPWGRVSYGVADTWWAQMLPYAGFTGVSFLLALTGSALAWAVAGGWRRPGLAAGVAVALALVTVGPVLAPYQPERVGSATVAVVQGDVPGDGTNVLLDHRQVTENQRIVTERIAADVAAGRSPEPDFVLWPENSTAVDPFANADIRATITAASQAVGVPILVGALVDGAEPGTVLNQGIVWRPEVGATERYSKSHPVPFGEYIPWRGKGPMKEFENFGRLTEISRDMAPGRRETPLRIGGIRVADAICFDVAYDDVFTRQVGAGAELITVQTSNAMFIRTHQIDQQFEITRLRALASGRSLAVASTNGISGVIGPDGEVRAQAPIRTRTSLTETVPLVSQVTPAVRLGAWPARLSWLVALLALAAVALRRGGVTYRRGRADAEPPASPRALVPAGPTPEREGRP